MRFSGNAPPTGWLPSISSMLDLDRFATELALAAAIRNICHIAARKVAVFCLAAATASRYRSRHDLCAKNGQKLSQIGHPRGVF